MSSQVFGISKHGNSLSNIILVFHHRQWKSSLLYLSGISCSFLFKQFVFVASCPFIKYHCEPVSLFFTFSHQVFICIDKILLSLLFFKLNRTISLSPSSYAKSLNNLHSTMELACSSMPMSILFWKAQRLTLQISPELTTGEGSLPITCCQHFS